MAQTVVGMFETQNSVEAAINELKDLNYDTTSFSVLMKDVRTAEEIENNTGTTVAKGAASGAATGGILAGIAGLIVGISGLVLPGVGPFLVAGPVATALGLTGVAATTTTGAVTGALAGGLIGALTSLGFTDEQAQKYEEHIRGGGILLIVPSRDKRAPEVKSIMTRHSASDVADLDLHENVAQVAEK